MFNNFIANMYGPDFLKFFLILIVVAIYLCRRTIKTMDTSMLLACPKIAENIDPYEVAYLRGGSNEVIRLAVFYLKENGYISTSSTSSSKQHEFKCGSKPFSLSGKPFEYEVYKHIERYNKLKANELFLPEIVDVIERKCSSYREKGLQQNLLYTTDILSRSKKLVSYTFLGLLGLGGYKLLAAIARGYSNIGFLVFLLIVLFITMVVWLGALADKRLTKLGEQYISNLQAVFEHAKKKILNEDASLDFDYPLAISVFGLGVLSNSSMGNAYKDTFTKGTSSSCGGGCGGSGCGGGGCGGGCGGCGG